MRRPGFRVLLVIAAAGFPPRLLHGDVVWVRNRTPAVGVEIVRLTDGRIEYRRPGGELQSRPMAEVAYLEITGWRIFNEAEEHRRQGQWRQAETSYLKALQESGRTTAGGRSLDRRLLIEWRLIAVREALGNFEQAVEAYLYVAERMPGTEPLRPARVPAAGSPNLNAAAELVRAAIQRHEGRPLALSLTEWLGTWPGQVVTTQPAASPIPAIQPSPSPANALPATPTVRPSNPPRPPLPEVRRSVGLPVETPGQPALRTASPPAAGHPHAAPPPEVAAGLASGDYATALDHLDRMLAKAIGGQRAEIYYWQGRVLFQKANATSPPSAADLKRAGMAFMRVVIHYPRHPLAPECLYHAAQTARLCGERASAADLCAELIRSYPDARLWVERARSLIADQPGEAGQR